MEREALKTIAQPIRAFIQEQFLFGYEEEDFPDDMSFLEHGIIDSLGILELISFIEAQFEIKVQDEEILPENMDSIDGLCQFIIKKQGQSTD